MEITKSNSNSKIMDNQQTTNTVNTINTLEMLDETERKFNYQRQFSINKADIIELVSTPKTIKNSFSYINKVHSGDIVINSIKKNHKTKRSESCEIKNKNNSKTRKNMKTKSLDKRYRNNRKRKNIGNNKNSLNKNKKEYKSKIIKSVDLSSKNNISSLNKKRNPLKTKNKSYSNIKHLQINIIKNYIIIIVNNESEKENIKKKNEFGLIKNHSQNYSVDINKNIYLDSKLLKKKLAYKNNTINKNRNKIPISKFNNRSVDQKSTRKVYIMNIKKSKNNLNNKKDIYKDKDTIDSFLNDANNYEKQKSSNISMFFSPKQEPGNIKNLFVNKKIYKNSDANTTSKKDIMPIKARKNKNIILYNNIKKDILESNPISNKYYNNYVKNKKYQEKNSQHNSQLLSLFSQPNEDKSDKKCKNINKSNDRNITICKNAISPEKETSNIKLNNNNSRKNLFSRKNDNKNNAESKFVKTDISYNSQNKRKSQSKIKDNNNEKCQDIKLIKTRLSLDKIKQIIKRYVGNNVVEGRDNGNFKFICKTKFEKDDLIFHLELISKTYDGLTLKGILVKGETRYYKELLFKIKEKLN